MSYNPEKALWQEVLLRAVDDALNGVKGKTPKEAIAAINRARHYLTTPSTDLSTVCACADMDTFAVMERMRAKIAAAPTPEELVGATKPHIAKLSTVPARKTRKITKIVDRRITHDGQTHTIAQWSKRTGVPVTNIGARLNQGWSVERALTQPIGRRNRSFNRPGVVSNFRGSEGTGVGTSAQDTPKITFSEREAS